MMPHLTDTLVRNLPASATKRTFTSDDEVQRLKAQVTQDGAHSFVLRYSIGGRERLYTIGRFPDWSVKAAREEAKHLLRLVDQGVDPKEARDAERAEPVVNEMCDRYLSEHAVRKRSARDDESMIRLYVRPELGNRKVASITFGDIDKLHRKVTQNGTPYRANRLIALLSKMFNLAIRWEMRDDNPAKGVERNPEERRYRYLSGDELRRFCEALTAYPNRVAANAVMMLLLSGARRSEVLSATWQQFDLKAGRWSKPSAHTKQKREHHVPLSAPAQLLLVEMRNAAEADAKKARREISPFVFPTRVGDGHMTETKATWARLCKAAGITGARLHDLRHSFASLLVSSGHSLPLIGAMLGHTQTSTTARYAHLFDDPLRAAAERVGAIVTAAGQPSRPAEVVPLPQRSNRH
jgi:integrase